MLSYPVRLAKDGDAVVVSAPDFPELSTWGEDHSDALEHARDALEEAIAARIAKHEDIPVPTKGRKYRVTLPSQTALKALLYQLMHEEGVTKARLAKLLQVERPQIDRLLQVRHGTRLDQIDRAFAVLGKQVRFEVEEREDA